MGDEELRRDVAAALKSHLYSFATNPMPVEDTSPHGLKQGDFVGPYRIERVLGHGGMGDVYLAEHMGQSREMALKILPEDFVADAQRAQRFRQEARAVMALNHPGKRVAVSRGSRKDDIILIRDSRRDRD